MAAVEEIVKNVFSWLGPDLEEKTNVLQRKVDLLEIRKDDVQEELGHEAYLPGKKRKREVDHWLINVEGITSEFETLKQEVQCSRVYKRQMLTEQVEIMTKEVTELLEQSDFPKGLFLEVNTSALIKHVCESIEDDCVTRIAILNEVIFEYFLAKEQDKPTSLGHVYQVRVSQNFSTYKLQSDVAHALNLDLSRVNDERKRANIPKGCELKTFLVVLDDIWEQNVLDDVWEQIDTEKIGIPLGSRSILIKRLVNFLLLFFKSRI